MALGAGALVVAAGGTASAQSAPSLKSPASCPITLPGHSGTPGSSSGNNAGGNGGNGPSTLYGYYTTSATRPAATPFVTSGALASSNGPLAFTGFDALGGSMIAGGLVAAGVLVVRLSRPQPARD